MRSPEWLSCDVPEVAWVLTIWIIEKISMCTSMPKIALRSLPWNASPFYYVTRILAERIIKVFIMVMFN